MDAAEKDEMIRKLRAKLESACNDVTALTDKSELERNAKELGQLQSKEKDDELQKLREMLSKKDSEMAAVQAKATDFENRYKIAITRSNQLLKDLRSAQKMHTALEARQTEANLRMTKVRIGREEAEMYWKDSQTRIIALRYE
jgi:chromosome segregation ATPase